MGQSMVIDFNGLDSDATTRIFTDCVLDINGLNEAIGIEIINLKFTTGSRPTGSYGIATFGSGEQVGWSYDEDSDALYVTLREERSLDQKNLSCRVDGTADGRLIRLVIESAGYMFSV